MRREVEARIERLSRLYVVHDHIKADGSVGHSQATSKRSSQSEWRRAASGGGNSEVASNEQCISQRDPRILPSTRANSRLHNADRVPTEQLGTWEMKSIHPAATVVKERDCFDTMANSLSSLTTIMAASARPTRVGGLRMGGIPDVPPLAISTPLNVISGLLPALRQAGMASYADKAWQAMPASAPTSVLIDELERVLPDVLFKRSSPLADISKLLLLLCDLYTHHQPLPVIKSLFRLVISALNATWPMGPHSELTNAARCALVQLSINTVDHLEGLAWLVARSKDEQWSIAHWTCTSLRWPSIISAMRKTSSLLVRAHLAALLECVAVTDPLWDASVAECSMVIKVDTAFKDALRIGSLAVVRHLAITDQTSIPTAIPHSSGWIALDRDGIWIHDCFIPKRDVISCKGGCIIMSPQTPRQMFSLAMTSAHASELDRLVEVITGRSKRIELPPTPARSATPLTGTSDAPIVVDTPEKRVTRIKSSPSGAASTFATQQSMPGPSRHRAAALSLRPPKATPSSPSRTSSSRISVSPLIHTFPNVQPEDLTYSGATFAQVCTVKVEAHETTGLVMPTITIDQIKAFPVRSDIYQLPLDKVMAGHLSQGVFVPVPAILSKVLFRSKANLLHKEMRPCQSQKRVSLFAQNDSLAYTTLQIAYGLFFQDLTTQVRAMDSETVIEQVANSIKGAHRFMAARLRRIQTRDKRRARCEC